MSSLEFGPEQIATFAPLAQVIEALALEHGLGLERTLDLDPMMTYAAYFLSWAPKRQRNGFIRIGALAPLVVGADFEIAAICSWKHHRNWSYSIHEGLDRFSTILLEAAEFVEAALLTEQNL